MNNQNPLIPQGSALEQKNRGRARMKIAVFFVLAIHGIGLMALLMQGCGQSKEAAPPTETVASNQPPAFVETTNVPVATSNVPVVVANQSIVEPPVTPVAPAGVTEYAIAKGDTFSTIAKKFHVTAKAIADANPGVDSTKLQVGKKIHIPAAAAPAVPTAAGVAPVETTSAGGEQTYKVKSGDNLTKIATQHGISVKALRAANALRTDSIKVGQALKIPAKSASAPVMTPAAPAAPAEPAPASTTSPVPTPPPGR
jgi:LysM repeat protein